MFYLDTKHAQTHYSLHFFKAKQSCNNAIIRTCVAQFVIIALFASSEDNKQLFIEQHCAESKYIIQVIVTAIKENE